jgi:hypothetical protein
MRFVLSKKQMEDRDRLIRLEARQEAHEDGCTRKWESADSAIRDTKEAVDKLEAHIDVRFDRVSDERNREREARDKQHAANYKILITILLAVVGFIGAQAFGHIFSVVDKVVGK